MKYEPMYPKDLLKGATKLDAEGARKAIDAELSKPTKNNSSNLIIGSQLASNASSAQFLAQLGGLGGSPAQWTGLDSSIGGPVGL